MRRSVRREVSKLFRTLLAILALVLWPASHAAIFAEGYSSAVQSTAADIRFRAFTLYSREAACNVAPAIAEIKVLPDPIRLQVGERIHRSNVTNIVTELIVEAYNSDGEFVPGVPIIVELLDNNGVTATRSDWNYLEAQQAGVAELLVRPACLSSAETGHARVQILVTATR